MTYSRDNCKAKNTTERSSSMKIMYMHEIKTIENPPKIS